MRLLVVCYSKTHATATVAARAVESLREAGHSVVEHSIRPRIELPRPLWLALSFIPGSRVPLVEPVDPADFDACLLAFPKWTLSCPPVNAFLARRGTRLPATALLMTYGGWDETRYLRTMEHRLERMDVRLLGSVAVKRRDIGSEDTATRLDRFLRESFVSRGRVASPLRPPRAPRAPRP